MTQSTECIEKTLCLAREAYAHELNAVRPNLRLPEAQRKPLEQLQRVGDMICLLQNILHARSAPVVPPGWKLVPVEATQAMYEAAASFGGRGGYSRQRGDDALEVWEEMLAAAPQPPVQLPDPVAVVYLNRIQYSTAVWHGQIPDGTKLYTEHQLRQLLAQHGITGSSHGQPT